MTYQELDDLSTRLACLLHDQGIGRGARVGLYMTKSVKSVISMVGILKAGAAYVPLDPYAPVRRVGYILDNCQVAALITAHRPWKGLSQTVSELATLRLVLLADVDNASALSDRTVPLVSWQDLQRYTDHSWYGTAGVETDPAYLLYTSGSTGQPKGVIISHRNAISFVEWGATTFGVKPEDRLSNHAPLHFDLSVFDIYAAMRTGACVIIVPEEVMPFPVQLAQWIDTQNISIWYSVPSALIRLLLHGGLERFPYRSLQTILFAGEVFPIKYLRELMGKLSHVAFYNLYGPTETNVCTNYKVPPLPATQTQEISIGQACADTEVFIIDEQGHLVSPGEVGELLVRGPSVMLGYWGLPERTAQSLIPNPVQAAYEEKVYRTGDFVRQAPDGNLVFLGRKDNMVKSRGYRIELGEIENTLHQHEAVREAVVIPMPDAETGVRLTAVIALHSGTALTASQLGKFCLARLPKYTVPETIIFHDELPKTSTGKIDRLALRNELQGH